LLKGEGYHIASINEIVKLRLAEEDCNGFFISADFKEICKNMSAFDMGPILVKDAILCIPGENASARITNYSPLIEGYTEYVPGKGLIVQENCILSKRSKHCVLSEQQYKKSLDGSIKFPIKKSNITWGFAIPLENITSYRTLVSFLGDGDIIELQQYQQKLVDSKLKGLRIFPELEIEINSADHPFVKQIIYGAFNDYPEINLSSMEIFKDEFYHMIGVRKKDKEYTQELSQ
jgi:hypothetical protein